VNEPSPLVPTWTYNDVEQPSRYCHFPILPLSQAQGATQRNFSFSLFSLGQRPCSSHRHAATSISVNPVQCDHKHAPISVISPPNSPSRIHFAHRRRRIPARTTRLYKLAFQLVVEGTSCQESQFFSFLFTASARPLLCPCLHLRHLQSTNSYTIAPSGFFSVSSPTSVM
jgi:hypothetical protein